MNDIIKKIGKGMLMAALLLGSSCQSDEPANGGGSSSEGDGGNVSAVTFSLSPRKPGDNTRAQQDLRDNEKMQSWRVLFVKGGKVAAVVSKDNVANLDTDTFDLALANGTYDIYAFANLPALRDNANAITALKQGSDFNASTLPSDISLNAFYADENQLIPMSRHMQYTKTDKTEIQIELIRMLGKVEFEFTNESSTDLEVKVASFEPLYAGPVKWMPQFVTNNDNKDFADNGSEIIFPTILDGNTLAGSSINLEDAVSVPKNNNANPVLKHFYVHETLASADTKNQFLFSLNIKRTNEDGTETQDEQRYALTGTYSSEDNATPTVLSAIRRNDYIQIPVTITDYKVELEVVSYPPIGGYPANVTTDNKGKFFVDFYTGGKFKLKPIIKKYNPATKVWDTIATSDVTMTRYVEDNNGILKAQNTAGDKLIDDNGEIIGYINFDDTEKSIFYRGTAEVTATFTIKESGDASRVLTRKIYITRTTKQ